MFTWRSGVLMAAVLAAGVASLSLADEPKKPSEPKEIKSQRKDMQESAAAINFGKAFGLDFDSLETVGERIQQAREAGDPVALSNAANELAVAENVSGKKASLTSAALFEEAGRMATFRDSADELKAVALLTPDEAARKKLGETATAAQKRADDRAARIKSGEKDRGIQDTLIVVNRTNDRMSIVVNDIPRGYVRPHGTGSFYIGEGPFDETELEAFASDGHFYHDVVPQQVGDFTWTLYE